MISIGDVNTKVYIGDTEAKVYIGDELIYPTGQHDYSQDYLTFKITASGNIRLMNIKNYSQARKTIQYSKDGGTTWTSVTSADGSDSSPFTGATLIPVVAGEVLLFKGNYVSYGASQLLYRFRRLRRRI